MSDRTCFRGANETLLDTLVDLLRIMGESAESNGQEYTIVGICPDPECDAKNIHVPVDTHETGCPECGTRVLTVDALRLHECFVESGSNEQAYNRLMLAAEHLLAAHSLRHLRKNNLSLIARMAIVMDGPLSVNGEPATIHKGIMQLIHDINLDLKAQGFGPAIVMGLTKSGFAVDHFANLDHEIPSNVVFALNDTYRYEYITGKPHDGTKAFGDRTYYGQDFLLKTPTGHQFLICMAYPWAKKTDSAFKTDRFDPFKYEALGTALALVTTLESDLYTNSMVPVILAHEYASISLAPGGKVLDLATARAVGAN
jgi:hypothetical protein